MPCEKITQVAGTLIPQESRTLRSNQLDQEAYSTEFKIRKTAQALAWAI
jgi:hypothetical protein